MSIRPIHLLYSGALAVGLSAGAFGVATAASRQADPPPTTAAPAPGAAPSTTEPCPGKDKAADDAGEQAEDKAKTDALAAQAKVNEQQARDAAAKAAGGTATKAKLEKERGVVVWSVDVTKPDNSTAEVQIDANTGAVIAQDPSKDDGD